MISNFLERYEAEGTAVSWHVLQAYPKLECLSNVRHMITCWIVKPRPVLQQEEFLGSFHLYRQVAVLHSLQCPSCFQQSNLLKILVGLLYKVRVFDSLQWANPFDGYILIAFGTCESQSSHVIIESVSSPDKQIVHQHPLEKRYKS